MTVDAISPLGGSANTVLARLLGAGGIARTRPTADATGRPHATPRMPAIAADPGPTRPAISATSYQRSADGDEAFLGSQVGGLTPAERRVVDQLAARDREVRAHEQAHLAAAGPYAQGVSYDYQTGPDGRQYAVGGSVAVDTAPIPGDPQATIAKAQQLRRAALAPAQPSAADRAVAAKAARMEMEARRQLDQHGPAGSRTVTPAPADRMGAQPGSLDLVA